MHKPPVMILRSNDNARHLRELGDDFRKEKINIRAIGGGEHDGIGGVTEAWPVEYRAVGGRTKRVDPAQIPVLTPRSGNILSTQCGGRD